MPQSSSFLLALFTEITSHGNFIFRSLPATLNLPLSLQSMTTAKNDNQIPFNSLQLYLHRPRPSLLKKHNVNLCCSLQFEIKKNTWAVQTVTGMLVWCCCEAGGRRV
jgi:hypothetical protein